MKLRTILAGTALAALALAGAPQLGAQPFASQAEAAVDVNIGIFYNQLGSYGDWVRYDNQYVFIPGQVDSNWRPYTEGHWVYTRRYGWTWVSDEPFGWATYHYGRWGYAEDIGWYWVPGRRWAPAWVSWRRSNNYVVWAPMPPSRHGGVDVSIDVNVGDIPDYYWVAVPTQRFLAPDINVVVVNDYNVVEQTQYIGTPRITNNIVVNNVIDVNVISQATGKQVQAVEVKTTDNPAEAKATANSVTAFQGELAADTKAKPPKVADMSKVRKVKLNKAVTTDQNATAPDANGTATAPVDNTGTAAGTANTNQPGNGKNKKSMDARNKPAAPGSDAVTTTGEQPATQAQDQAGGNKKKKMQNGNASAPAQSGQPVQAQDQGGGKKKKKMQNDNASAPAQSGQPVQAQDQGGGKKKKKMQNDNASAPAQSGQPVQAQDQGGGKKKKKLQQGEDATGSTSMAPSQPGKGKGNGNAGGANAPDQNANTPADQKRKGKGKKDQPCDPNTDATCAAQ